MKTRLPDPGSDSDFTLYIKDLKVERFEYPLGDGPDHHHDGPSDAGDVKHVLPGLNGFHDGGPKTRGTARRLSLFV